MAYTKAEALVVGTPKRREHSLAPQNDKDEANTSVTESDPGWEHGKT